jgi:hypothetical protein
MGGAGWGGLQAIREGRWGDGAVGLVFGLVLLIGVGGVAFVLIRSWLLRGRFGEIEMTVEPEVVSAGGALSVRISFSPQKETSLQGAVLRLRGFERVVSGSGTNKTTRTHELHSEELEIAPAQLLMSHRPVRLEGAVNLPIAAGPSFAATSNMLKWTVEVRLLIARFPDWRQTREVVVVPWPGDDPARSSTSPE